MIFVYYLSMWTDRKFKPRRCLFKCRSLIGSSRWHVIWFLYPAYDTLTIIIFLNKLLILKYTWLQIFQLCFRNMTHLILKDSFSCSENIGDFEDIINEKFTWKLNSITINFYEKCNNIYLFMVIIFLCILTILTYV